MGHILEASLRRFVDGLDAVGIGEIEVKGERRKSLLSIRVYSMPLQAVICDLLWKNTKSTIN